MAALPIPQLRRDTKDKAGSVISYAGLRSNLHVKKRAYNHCYHNLITCLLLCLLTTLAAEYSKNCCFFKLVTCVQFALVFSLKNRPRPGPHRSDLTALTSPRPGPHSSDLTSAWTSQLLTSPRPGPHSSDLTSAWTSFNISV